MGEAKMRELATRAALNGQSLKVQLQPMDFLVVLELDIACHMLQGVANQLVAVGKEEPAKEVAKSLAHLQAYRSRFVADAQQKLVIAQPGDVPPAAGH